jgi:hypothetical protein
MAVAPTYANNIPGGVHVPGDRKEVLVTGTVGAADTYVTGGFSFTPAQVGLSTINYMAPVVFSTGHWGIFLPATNLIKVFSAAATELANASTALQSATFAIKAIGS